MNSEEWFTTFVRMAFVALKRGVLYERDKFLVLVAVHAVVLDRWNVAEACCTTILEHNSGHMIGKYESLRDALKDAGWKTYVRRLQREWPLEKLETVLDHPRVQDYGLAELEVEILLADLIGGSKDD